MPAPTIYIVDDEELGIEVLEHDIQSLDLECVIKTFSNSKIALSEIRKDPPDILLLDIEMPELNGFQLLDALDTISFSLIFITAYDHYAIKAFRYFAIDYLLKPVDKNNLKTAIERALNLKKENEYVIYKALLDQLKTNNQKPITKIAIATGEAYEFVEIADIIRCKADNNYSKIYMTNGKEHLISKGLSHLQKILQEHDFFRCHKSHLINMKHIKRYVRTEGGYIEMVDKSIVGLSRSKKEDFAEHLKRMRVK